MPAKSGLVATWCRPDCAARPATACSCPAPSSSTPTPAGGQAQREPRHQGGVGLQAVGAAVQRAAGLMASDLRHQPGNRGTVDVGGIGQDEGRSRRRSRRPNHRRGRRRGMKGPAAAALRRARPAASGERSTPMPNASGYSDRAAQQQAAGAGAQVQHAADQPPVGQRGECRLDQGLGVGTRGSVCRAETSSVRVQNPCRPVMKANGSRAARRATSASKAAASSVVPAANRVAGEAPSRWASQ